MKKCNKDALACIKKAQLYRVFCEEYLILY